jgi:hypothetical protein
VGLDKQCENLCECYVIVGCIRGSIGLPWPFSLILGACFAYTAGHKILALARYPEARIMNEAC